MKLAGFCFACCAISLSLCCTRSGHREHAASSTASTSASAPAASHAVDLSTQGEPYALRLVDGALFFCDTRGAHRVDLSNGKEESKQSSCPKKEDPDPACSMQHDVSVRSSLSQPDDIVELGVESITLKGRVHDCSADGKLLGVVTASTVTVIDTAKESSTEVSQTGGDRVTLGSGWIAWTSGSTVHALKLKT